MIPDMHKTNLTLRKRQTQNQMLLTEALDAFLLDLQAGNRTPKTIAYYKYELSKFKAWCAEPDQDVTTLGAICPDTLRHYVIFMQHRHLKGTSQQDAWRAIRAFMNWCVRQEYLAVSPAKNVTMPKAEKDILPALTVEEVKALLEACTIVRDEALILFLLDTGCRVSECVALNVGDVDRHSGEVIIRQGKGRKSRVVYISDKARRVLAKYLLSRCHTANAAPLWISSRSATEEGTRLTVSGLQQTLRRVAQRAGVDEGKTTPHAFRRTCALLCHRNGWRITEIQKLLGHSDLSVLRRYLDLDNEDIQAAHERYSPSDDLK